MEIKRVPHLHGKESPVKANVKNHPRKEESVEGAIPVRHYPPWNGRGASGGASRLKNHPR